MATKTKTGSVKSIAAGVGTFLVELDVPNESPPPATVPQSWEVSDAGMQRLVSGAKIGDSMTITYDDASPTTPTTIKRP